MKLFLSGLFIILLSFTVYSQDHHKGGGRDIQKRINQLEKVKLLEELELDDEAAVRFFNLKDQHQKKMTELRERSDVVVDKIQETISPGESKKESSLNRLFDEYQNNEEELFNLRKKFLSDIQNVLTPEKYAKFLVFERNFREEIRKIMNDRMKRRMRTE